MGVAFNDINDLDHYLRVRKARKEQGLPVAELQEMVQHPLQNNKIRNVKTGKIYNIVSIHKEWYFGWFYKAIIECNGSHGVIYIDNINSHDETIHEIIEKNKSEYEFMSV